MGKGEESERDTDIAKEERERKRGGERLLNVANLESRIQGEWSFYLLTFYLTSLLLFLALILKLIHYLCDWRILILTMSLSVL